MNSNTKSVLSLGTITEIVQAHFGATCVVDAVSEITEGWFNAIYQVTFTSPKGTQEVILKTGVQEGKYTLSYEKNLMHAEVAVYHLLSETVVPTPKIIVEDFSKTLVDCDYFIMEKLQGDNWGHWNDRISPENNEQLITEIARYTAALHQIKGSYFGYIREDEDYHFSTWRSAFFSMVHHLMEDGRNDDVDLPYDAVQEALDPLWVLLEEVNEPCLVNFDLWKKNIMLIEQQGEYHIDGLIDHERSFFGDPYAEFVSSNTICGEVATHVGFQVAYSGVSGKPFIYTRNDHIRHVMYNIYLSLLMGTEVYRYNEEDKAKMLTRCTARIWKDLERLQQFAVQ